MGVAGDTILRRRGKFLPHSHVCNHRQGTEVNLCSFLNSSLDGCGWSASRLGYFITRTEHWYPLRRRMGE